MRPNAVIHRLSEISPDLTLRNIKAFFEVAEYPGLSLSAYAKLLDMPVSTTCRVLLELSDHSRTKRHNGLGLLTRTVNPASLRENIYDVSEYGRKLLADIETP